MAEAGSRGGGHGRGAGHRGPAALRARFHGDGGHAGAQLMPLRNDASLAAAELALKVEEVVLATGLAAEGSIIPIQGRVGSC